MLKYTKTKYFTEDTQTSDTISDKHEPMNEDIMMELAIRKSLEEHRLYLDSLLDQERAMEIAIARSKDEMQWEISQKCMQKMHQDSDTTLGKEKSSKNRDAKAEFLITKSDEIPPAVLERQKYWKEQYEKLTLQQKDKQAVKVISYCRKLTEASKTVMEDKENTDARLRINQRIREEMFS